MAVQTQPYDTAQTALSDAIIFSNDGGGPAGMTGNILNPATNPQVLPAFQERYRYLQQRLISSGVDTFTKEGVVFGLSPSATSSPRVRMYLTFQGYFNGQVWVGPDISAPPWSSIVVYTQGMTATYNNSYYVAQPNSGTNLNQNPSSQPQYWTAFSNIGPCLPADLIKPLEIWECQTGGNAWVPMKQQPDAITTNVVQPRFQQWVFANDKLVLPGASFTNDLRIKYLAVAPDIANWNSIIYPRACSTALALLVLDQLSGARGGPMAAMFKLRAEEAISQIVNQTVRKQAYAQFIRRAYKGSGRNTGGRSGI